ncbi:MAG: hypothetical protein V7K47_31350 [Nostoc sp.]
MFLELVIINGCNGVKRLQYAIAIDSIHNKISQKVDFKLLLGDCIPHF